MKSQLVSRRIGWVALATVASMFLVEGLWGETVTLKNGIQLTGILRTIPSINESADALYKPPSTEISKIAVIDDNLKRVYVSTNNLRADGLAPDVAVAQERIVLDKRVAPSNGRIISTVGPIMEVTDFDEFGNRRFTMNSSRGPVDVVQGITLVSPDYIKLEGLMTDNPLRWDMRIATSSIPREKLSRILLQYLNPKNPQDRLRVVTLYIQAKRYRDALIELEQTLSEFPGLRDLETQRKRLYQLVAEDVIREIELRREAGQHGFAYALLQNFPEEEIAGEILLKVGDILKEYDEFFAQKDRTLTLLTQHYEGLEDPGQRDAVKPLVDELVAELNINTVGRMADYLRLSEDTNLAVDQKLALAVSGWLLGSGGGIQNLAEALSLAEVRKEVQAYLRTAANQQLQREEILGRLEMLEGSSPRYLAQLIAHMKPPVETEMPLEGPPGQVKISVPGLREGESFEYLVQLPPEYDPYRRYPCVLTLHAAGMTAEGQVDWWTGAYSAERQTRPGQATRHGYIVIAPLWAEPRQREYRYSVQEHAAVLFSLRDALKRFSIDTDRVFLSGHSMGGDAAWDIGLAHPDLWAGIVPIVASADKYISMYWENGKYLPMYFVGGEMDGNRLADNARDIDRYMRSAGFDVMYSVYIGRGHEHFQDDIQNIFTWLDRQRRPGPPERFEVYSMRPWDRFYWWLELDEFPDFSMVLPELWPQPKAKRAKTEGRVLPSNGLLVQTPAALATIWLSPEIVDFDQRISVNGRDIDVSPNARDLLEDVRTRGDRQHPFWAQYRLQLGRRR